MNRLWPWVAILLILTPLRAIPQMAEPNRLPAFLDADDRIRVALDRPLSLVQARERFTFRLGGQDRAIRAVRAVGPAATGADQNDPAKVTLPGTLQAALGGTAWDPASNLTRMENVGPGLFEFVAALPAGTYQYKVARGGSWNQNWGVDFRPNGVNLTLRVPADGTVVRFVVDFNRQTIRDSINHPAEVTAPAKPPARRKPRPVTGDLKYRAFDLILARPVTPREIMQPMEIRMLRDPARRVFPREVLNAPDYYSDRSDFGAKWREHGTTFRVWSPVARTATVELFRDANSPAYRRVPMRRGPNGTWFAEVEGDLHGVFYQYVFESLGAVRRAADIYGVAAAADSKRSMVVDLRRTNPEGWPAPEVFRDRPQTDAIIYEAHVRDLTVDPSGGMKPEYRGKYLGVSQPGTRVPGTGQKTGLDYLVDLGVTHLHLLPIQNFNPAHSQGYNWGYETTLFNVPEEQYSTRPQDPLTTVRETKAMIAGLQRAGIGVVLDVVYNHTVPDRGEASAFWETVPYYYFRTNDRGDLLNESGVGNALHDDRPMVRKFVRDSLLFWLEEYKIDGFRFDLLGMFTRDTVFNLSRAMRRVKPNVVLYGEPWTGGGPTRFGKGAQRGSGMAVFNDNLRNALRGDLDGDAKGFAMGGKGFGEAVRRGIVGSIDFSETLADFAATPLETLNYVSAHDNLTLWDKVAAAMPGAPRKDQEAAVRLALGTVLVSQGVAFLEGGVQIGRTKGGNHNSYNAGDEVNRYDWARGAEFQGLHEFTRGLIAIRRAHPVFRLGSAAKVKENLLFLASPNADETVVFQIEGSRVGDAWRQVVVILHSGDAPAEVALPEGEWNVAVDGARAVDGSLGKASRSVKVEPRGMRILWR